MHILGLGIDYETGLPLVPPLDEQALYDLFMRTLEEKTGELDELARPAQEGEPVIPRELERRPTADQGDPTKAGWTYLVNAADPQLEQIREIIRPLAERRGMPDPDAPLLYHGETQDQWVDWMTEQYSPLVLDTVPLYVLIVGGPEMVPFWFQSMFASTAAVGRVRFENLDDLQVYVQKVIRLETAPAPVPTNQAIFFAPDGGRYDATSLSRRYLVEPLIRHVKENTQAQAAHMLGDPATKRGLEGLLRGARPALVFTASHGLAAPRQELTVQRRINGAICCQDPGGYPLSERIYAAEDVPSGEPFLEGAIFFQFACFGYGTPAESDYQHWLGQTGLNSQADFIAALPQRLLAHPRGPLACIGHLDMAWLHGFADPADPPSDEMWSPRIAPFVTAVEDLLHCYPPGLAMRDMNKRYNMMNAHLSNTYDRIQRGKETVDDKFKKRLASLFITRSDAQNYMVFGDPAVQVRIGLEGE